MSKTHKLSTEIVVDRGGRSIKVVVKGTIAEAENQLQVVAVSAHNPASGDAVDLLGYERDNAVANLTRLVTKQWAEAARQTMLALAKKLVDDKYNAQHSVPRDAAIARRSDGNALARLIIAFDADLLRGRFPLPPAWVRASRDPNEALSAHAPAAFDVMLRLASQVQTLPGATYEALAVEAKGLASRAGFAPRSARH